MITPRLIAVTGLVGVGKTTLAENLARLLNARLILEEYDKNPYLARQLAGDADAGLLSELFFLFSRARQLDRAQFTQANSPSILIADYLFEKNRLFAQINLSKEDMKVFGRIEQSIKAHVIPANMVIYMQDNIENCLERIRKRGRPAEAKIDLNWLKTYRDHYEKLMNAWSICPVLRLNIANCDVRSLENCREIVEKIEKLGRFEAFLSK